MFFWVLARELGCGAENSGFYWICVTAIRLNPSQATVPLTRLKKQWGTLIQSEFPGEKQDVFIARKLVANGKKARKCRAFESMPLRAGVSGGEGGIRTLDTG